MDSIATWFSEMWDQFRKAQLRYWAVLMTIIGLAWEGLDLIGQQTLRLFNGIVGVIDHALSGGAGGSVDLCGGALQETLAIGNTFFPLDETFRKIFALVVFVWLPLGIYRLVKSWIPTLSGGG